MRRRKPSICARWRSGERARAYHPSLSLTLNNLAYLHFLQQDWLKALTYFNRSIDIVVARSMLAGPATTSRTRGEGSSESWRFLGAVKAAYRLALNERERTNALMEAAFRSAQLSETSQTAASLTQMVARQAKANGPGGAARAAGLGRRMGQARDKQLIAALSRSPSQRDAAAEAALSERLAAIETRSADIKAHLAGLRRVCGTVQP